VNVTLIQAMSKIRISNVTESVFLELIKNIQLFLNKKNNFEHIQKLVIELMKQNESDMQSLQNNWQIQVVKDAFIMKTNPTFQGACIAFLKQKLQKYLSFIVYRFLNDGVTGECEMFNQGDIMEQYF
jgi:hypothetical protein